MAADDRPNLCQTITPFNVKKKLILTLNYSVRASNLNGVKILTERCTGAKSDIYIKSKST
jgi:hypothetical protein